MSVWGDWNAHLTCMFPPAGSEVSMRLLCLALLVFFFCSKNEHVSEKSYNIHLWQFWKFPRRRVCLKNLYLARKRARGQSHVARIYLHDDSCRYRVFWKGSQGCDGDTVIFRCDHRHGGLYLSYRHVICTNNLGSLTDCGTYQGTVSQTVAAKMRPFLDFRTNCIMFPLSI